jgi:hypothetical protein
VVARPDASVEIASVSRVIDAPAIGEPSTASTTSKASSIPRTSSSNRAAPPSPVAISLRELA